MAKELQALYDKVNISGESVLNITGPNTVGKKPPAPSNYFYLVAKIALGQKKNVSAMIQVMKKAWTLDVKVLGENLALFWFDKAIDRSRVLEGWPWNFDQSMVLMKELDQFMPISTTTFDECSIRVHAYNLVVGFMNDDMAHQIGDTIGTFLEAQPNADGHFIDSTI